jgi:hypothetical protein
MYAETGRYRDAVETARRGLLLATEQGNTSAAAELKSNLDRYEALARGGA